MSKDRGYLDGLPRPGIPVVDMDVRTADARLFHTDQHVIDADLGLGHILKPKARLRLTFNDSFHYENDISR